MYSHYLEQIFSDRKFAQRVFPSVTGAGRGSTAHGGVVGLSDSSVFSAADVRVKPANDHVNKRLRDGHRQGHRLMAVTQSGAGGRGALGGAQRGAQPVH